VYVGGDTYDTATIANRYVAVVVPLLAVLVGVALSDLASSTPAGRRRTLMAGVALGVLTVVAVAAGAGVRFWLHSQLGGVPALPAVGWRVLPPLAMAATVLAAVTFLRRRPQWAFACVALTVAVAFTGRDLWMWARYNTAAATFSKQMTRYGLDLRRATDDQAVIATGAAGAIGYYSHREVVDLLGYSDSHIAHEPPATPVFIPGHDKFDYAYSVLGLRPDIVASVASIPESAAQAILRGGYRQVGPGVFIRNDSTHVDGPALDQADARLYGSSQFGRRAT
jgi:hypothetical protein